MTSCTQKFGDNVERMIGSNFTKVGNMVGSNPRKTMIFSIVLTIACAGGFARWSTENRAEKLWVPQATQAELETDLYSQYFGSTSRINTILVTTPSSSNDKNVLTKELLLDAMSMHTKIATETAEVDNETYDFVDLCTSRGGACASKFGGICDCFVISILSLWNYDIDTLASDEDVLATINESGDKANLEAQLAKATFDSDDKLVSAEAYQISYFLEDRSAEAGSDERGTEDDPINEAWELDVFLANLESAPSTISVDYFAGRSFADEFGGAITGDLAFVQVSYIIVFLFLGASLGNIKCGLGSRWSMSLAALFMVILSVVASFAISSAIGLFYGPVHTLLPFILLGIGVDNAFVIVNAFNRERNVKRSSESNDDIAKRCGRALARAGASITVTSATDLVAFGISASSNLPALASFCGYAAVGLFFLWFFASTFFTAALVLDERRQRDNRRECCCCLTRKKTLEEPVDGFEEGIFATYFRKYHAPAILSKIGKILTLLIFGTIFGLGAWGAVNLSVEDTERSFIPQDSYVTDYINAIDDYYPTSGIDLFIGFEGSSSIYENREYLANLDSQLTGLSTSAPYISEPIPETYRNIMQGLSTYLNSNGSAGIGNVTLGDDMWPTTEADFVETVANYANFRGPGSIFATDVSFSESGTEIEAIRVKCEYISLTKKTGKRVIDDAEKQIKAMDTTRELVSSWADDVPESFTYSQKFLAIEGFKLIRRELFTNVGLAFASVALIVFLTVASPMTSLLVTVNVAFCIIEILGFMYFLDIAIDSVSVINIVLAVGLSIDYSAHIGHCFMHKGGDDKNTRTIEALSDIGAAVLNGAITTFLAVAVLLFSSSYVFKTLSLQFALTVCFGAAHGLILLPVLLSLFGPKAFAAADKENHKTEESDEA